MCKRIWSVGLPDGVGPAVGGRLEPEPDRAAGPVGLVPVTTTSPDGAPTLRRYPVMSQAGFSLIAAAVSAFRAVRTDPGNELTGVALASIAAVLALSAAVLAFRSQRWAAAPLAGALVLELVVLDTVNVAPPRLLNAIPLLFALALALVAGRPADNETPSSPVRTVTNVAALALMVPVGTVYLVTGLVAPTPDVYGVYALFALLLLGAVSLARRRSRWVVAVPLASAALWPLVVWAGGTLLDWSA